MIVGISQHLIPKIEERQMNLSIFVDAYPDRIFPVEYFEIYPTLDKKTKLAKLELRLKNPFKIMNGKRLYLLKPGMFACAILELKQREQIVAVPTSSIVSIHGKHFIFVENEGKAQRKEVAIGIQDNCNTEILEGLREGEKLIVEGQHKLVDGVVVEGETILDSLILV
jgi:multidrug efflux pump subunit AcrA (membrane-fusion protein)